MSPTDFAGAFTQSERPSAASSVVRSGAALTTSSSTRGVWGQPDASYYVFSVHGRLMKGKFYLGTTPELVTPELAAELAAWEALSDEAWLDFDSQLE